MGLKLSEFRLALRWLANKSTFLANLFQAGNTSFLQPSFPASQHFLLQYNDTVLYMIVV